MWQEASAPGGKFICGKKALCRVENLFVARRLRAGREIFCSEKAPYRAEDFFVVRESRAGREIFLW